MRSRPGAARTILLVHTISARPSKQPRMVGRTLRVYSFGLIFVSARTKKSIEVPLAIPTMQTVQGSWMVRVCYCSTCYKAVRVGVGDSGGHVPRETTSRGLCGLVCPSHTSECVCLLLQYLLQSCSRGTREETSTLTQGGALFSLVPLVWELNPKLQGVWSKTQPPAHRGI